METHFGKSMPWDLFDGRGGTWGVIHLSNSHSINFKFGMGNGSNNFSELISLKLVLTLALEHGVAHLQVSGDSLLVIKWMRKNLF